MNGVLFKNSLKNEFSSLFGLFLAPQNLKQSQWLKFNACWYLDMVQRGGVAFDWKKYQQQFFFKPRLVF